MLSLCSLTILNHTYIPHLYSLFSPSSLAWWVSTRLSLSLLHPMILLSSSHPLRVAECLDLQTWFSCASPAGACVCLLSFMIIHFKTIAVSCFLLNPLSLAVRVSTCSSVFLSYHSVETYSAVELSSLTMRHSPLH